MTIFWRFASLVEMFGDWVTCYSSLPIYMHDMSFCYLVFVSDCFCQFLSGCWFEVWNFTTFNRGSKATESSEWAVRERERQWAMKERAVGQIFGSSFHFDLNLLWHIRPTFPLCWASGCSAGGFTQLLLLISLSSFPELCSAQFQSSTHSKPMDIQYIVMSALTLSPCQVEPSVQGLGRERVGAENTQPQQDKRTPPTPSTHPPAYPFGLTPSSVMQDPRIQSLR